MRAHFTLGMSSCVKFEIFVARWNQGQRRSDTNIGGGGRHGFKINKNMAATSSRREFEAATVKGHKLVGLIVEAAPRQFNVSVRNYNTLKSRLVKILLMPSVNNRPVVAPVAVESEGSCDSLNGKRLAQPDRRTYGAVKWPRQ